LPLEQCGRLPELDLSLRALRHRSQSMRQSVMCGFQVWIVNQRRFEVAGRSLVFLAGQQQAAESILCLRVGPLQFHSRQVLAESLGDISTIVQRPAQVEMEFSSVGIEQESGFEL
jgi:hypothetical protein